MRLLHFSLVVLALAAACATQNTGKRQIGEVERARDQFWEIHGRGDAAALADALTDDAILMAPGVPDLRGRAAVRAAAEQMFSALRITDFKIQTSEIDVIGDTAYEVSTYSETLHPKDGVPTPVQGRYLIVWKQRADGRWLIHRNLFNFASGGH